MKILPEFSGPMAFWPRVVEIDGIVEALEKLLVHHKMAIGTNAANSNAEMVWKTLRRVGLVEYFSAVFMAGEIGFAKPEPRYFRQIESILALPPHALIMVGDDYGVDIIGAKSAGWQSVWYNPDHQIAPTCLPLQDADITSMINLPSAIQSLHLPDYPTCLAWLQEGGVPFQLLAHLNLVASTAYLLAAWLRREGQTVDPVLTHRGGMLHDVAKITSLLQNRHALAEQIDHAEMARNLLIRRGQPELAQIAHCHMLYQDPLDPRRPITWEQKLVYLADKLAEGSRLVSPQERIAALKHRYPGATAEIEAGVPGLFSHLEELCDHLRRSPDELIGNLGEALGQK